MRIPGRVARVTGGANGIDAAMARRFAADGARGVVVADLDGARAREVADEADRAGSRGLAMRCDVGDEDQVRTLIAGVLERFGQVDLFCSNAGVAFGKGADAATEEWDLAWRVNVLAHVFAARAVLPSMLARGAGYLLHTCSAAGLLTNPGDAPYTVSKHAAVAFAEWLAVTYGDKGVRISVLCPQGVRTNMLLGGLQEGNAAARAVAAAGELLEPEQVADAVVEGLDAERFLILPHPEVATYLRRKAEDPDRWLAGMRRLVAGAAAPGAAGAPRARRGAPGARLRRRLVGGGLRSGRVHAAGAGGGVVAGAAARHRDRAGGDPRPGAAGDERRRHGRGGARPLRARHRRLLADDRRAVERRLVRAAVPPHPRHAALRQAGTGRRAHRRGLRHLHGARLPAHPGAGGPAATAAGRPAPRHAAAGRPRGRRGDHQPAGCRRRAQGRRRAALAGPGQGAGGAPVRLPDRGPGPRQEGGPQAAQHLPERAGLR